MTILATPTLDLNGILGTVASASAISQATLAPVVAPFDVNAPFGQANGSLILPYGTQAPSNALIIEDPASIIFENSKGGANLFVQSISGFQSDCAAFGAQANALVNLASLQIFNSIQQASAAQIASLQLGTIQPVIPAAIIIANPTLASAAGIVLSPAQVAAQQAAVSGQATPQAAPSAPAPM
jgi:hypothetical protein